MNADFNDEITYGAGYRALLQEDDDPGEYGPAVHVQNLTRQKTSRKFRPARKAKLTVGQLAAPDSLGAGGATAASASSEASEAAFNFTYQASRHERQWIIDSLGGFYEQKWLNDVLALIKGGKEATVYLCAANPSSETAYLAAKVYRPRMFRNLKNDHVYQLGRRKLDSDGNQITNKGLLHAIQKKTDLGWELTHTSWIEYEYQTLVTLHKAGADVPRPYERGSNAILMAYIGAPGFPAPTLNTVDLRRELGQRAIHTLFERVVHNIELLLANRRIHGDLSAFNILYWEGEITLIDFPQVVDLDANPDALPIFERDVTRICEYFNRQGLHTDPHRLVSRLWKAQELSLAPEVDPHFLDAEDPKDRHLWNRQQEGL